MQNNDQKESSLGRSRMQDGQKGWMVGLYRSRISRGLRSVGYGVYRMQDGQ